MYAAMTRLTLKPDSIEDAVRAMEESLPALKREPGHRGALLLTGDANEAILIGLWETASDAEAWMTRSDAGQALRERYRALLAAPPPERIVYTVRVHDLP